jgi:hypothetical protein
MYVDDVCGVSRDEVLVEDLKESGLVITSLTGPKSIALHKDKSGRSVDWIGWGIDLDLQTVNVSKRNLLKCLHGFFFTDLDGLVSVKFIEKLASWCSRYSIILPSLKPLSVTLHGEHAGMRSREVQKRLSPEAKLVCWIWRVFLILIALQPGVYSRKIMSFKSFSSSMRVEYDASLTGLGLIISRKLEGDWITLKVLSIIVPYNLIGDSGYQNTMEFLAVTLAVCIIKALGFRDVGLDLIGDNTSSLSWAKYNRFKRGRSLRATLMFMRITSMYGININFADHLAGDFNIICDALSRGVSCQELGYTDEETITQQGFPWFKIFFELCNPLLDILLSENQFLDFWKDLSFFCDRL